VGVNNKQRRAAKKRKRSRRGGPGRPSQGPGQLGNPFATEPGWDSADAYALVDLQLTSTVRRLSKRRKLDDDEVGRHAESLARQIRPHPRFILDELLGELLSALTAGVREGGWGEADLTQLVRRCAGERHLSLLSELLREDPHLPLDTTEELASGLRLAALLSVTPLLEADQVAAGTADDQATEHPKLAQVRALLAKAESTDYDEEAEALSAKAQELITKYALDRLVDQSRQSKGGSAFQVRRLWLDAPYVDAKAALVHQVASANRCRAAVADRFGFSLVLGSAADIDAVEMLATSLLVQADAAMLRHGRRYDESGVPRTRSFRRSFLMAYAVRIGERLRAAEAEAVEAEHDDRLLPVLRDHRVKVDEAFDAMVPHEEGKAPSISNGEGWHAGLAAADLALLDVNGKLPSAEAG
jgi:hypothetical protein